MKHNGRTARLKIEEEKLINLSNRSEFIGVQPVEVQPGWPPEKYVVTFTCKGIVGVDNYGSPQSSDFHQVSIYLSRDFPKQEPYLKWLTPIWHPNIEHQEPHHVCTNNVQNWYPSKSLDDLIVALGEMVQYKRYHAEWAQPWPLDQDAAKWVREYAEPKGIVGPAKPFDERPLLRPYEMLLWAGKSEKKAEAVVASAGPVAMRHSERLKIGTKKITGELSASTEYVPSVVRKKGLMLGAAMQHMTCTVCGQVNRIRHVEGTTRRFFCSLCKAELTF